MTQSAELAELVESCRAAARTEHDLIIAGEGNASLTTTDGRLYVTASGSRMSELSSDDMILVDRDSILTGLQTATNDQEWGRVLAASVPAGARRPTVEVGLHAVYSAAIGAGVVLHTHPTSVLALMVQGRGEELAAIRLIPDHIVMCGTTSWYLPYIDPGLALARAVQDRLASATHLPSVLHLGHHGILVIGSTGPSALDVTLMVAKSARILAATPVGRATGLGPADIERIAGREDEHHRRRLLGLGGV